MKYATITMAVVFFVLTFFVIAMKNPSEEEKEKSKKKEETRAVYISYIELDHYVKDKDSTTSKKNIEEMLDHVQNLGMNTVILHVRPFADSIYPSEFYPMSTTVLNDKKEKPDYDVLEYFVEEAHKRDLLIEAWVNPFRISNLTDLSQIPIDSPYYTFVKTNDAKVIEGKGIYLNPASQEVRELIVKGIEEIVTKYDVDGIHFDDYFYPDKTIDLASYQEYTSSGGSLNIEDYRRENITTLIKDTYQKIKEVKPRVIFGIAPEGNLENDYNTAYLDVEEILSKKGYVDYIMPQIYYGFKNETKPFMETLATWNQLIADDSIQLIPALAFYKVGVEDQYALSGKREWIEENDIIKKQIIISRNMNHYHGFSLFRYDYLFDSEKENSNTAKEIENMKEVLTQKETTS